MSNNVQQDGALRNRRIGRPSNVELFIRSRDSGWFGSLGRRERDRIEQSNEKLRDRFGSRPLLALIVLLEKRILKVHQTRSKFVDSVEDSRLTRKPNKGGKPQKGDILHRQLGGRCRTGPEWWLAELVAEKCLGPQDKAEEVLDEIARMWCAAKGRSPDLKKWPEPFEPASEQAIAALIDPHHGGSIPVMPAGSSTGVSLTHGAPMLAALLDGLPDAVLLVDSNGTVVTVNSTARESFGKGDTGLTGHGLLELLPAFDVHHLPRPATGPRERPTHQSAVRMTARRTDGTEWLAEVRTLHITDGRVFYEPSFGGHAEGASSYVGNELLMVIARDLASTQDLETELVRQQRQTERILRTVSEGIIGVDTTGRIVLVNPAAAVTLGYPASELGGQLLHPLLQHSHADGSSLSYEKTLIAQTLRSGKARRQRGQVLWAKDGRRVPADLACEPIHDGDQIVGAVMTFVVRQPLRLLEGVVSRHALMLALMDEALSAPLKSTHAKLKELVTSGSGQPEPLSRALSALASEQARMTALVHAVMDYERLDTGQEELRRRTTALSDVVATGVHEAKTLTEPQELQIEVSASAVDVAVDPVRLSRALAHVLLDTAADASASATAGGKLPAPTIKVSAERVASHDPNGGSAVRIEVQGPGPGRGALHDLLANALIRLHGGTLRRRTAPEGGSVCTLEVPISLAGETPSHLPKPLWQATDSTEARPAALTPSPEEPSMARQPAARAEFVSPLPGPYTLASNTHATQGLTFETMIGVPVRAVHAGTITRAEWSREGYRVTLTLDDSCEITHHHLSSVARTSGHVRAGDIIGRVGAVDVTSHLDHTRKGTLKIVVRAGNGTPVSPAAWLNDHGIPIRGAETTHKPAATPRPEMDPAAAKPRTKTVLVTRAPINLPGSRPVPPIEIRTPIQALDTRPNTVTAQSAQKPYPAQSLQSHNGPPPKVPRQPHTVLVWAAPGTAAAQALNGSGLQSVLVRSREEIDAQLAARPAAVLVDPLTGPLTRTGVQSLRQASMAAEIPLLTTVGLGQAPREAAHGADPAVLLKALAPRDSEQHPPRVLIVEEQAEITIALTLTLERRGMQVTRASHIHDAVALTRQMRPNLVVMDLMTVASSQGADFVDELRSSGQLRHTPLASYTKPHMNQTDLDLLAAGRNVLFLAEPSTSIHVQTQILEMLVHVTAADEGEGAR